MPQVMKTPCLIQFWSWENSLFQLLALWGNKNWLPSMKVKKLEKFQNKMGLKDCKWSSLNAPGTQTPVSFQWLDDSHFPFSSLPLSGVIRIRAVMAPLFLEPVPEPEPRTKRANKEPIPLLNRHKQMCRHKY